MIWFHIPLKSRWQMPLRSFTNRRQPGTLPFYFPPSLPLSLPLPQACHSAPISPIPTSPLCQAQPQTRTQRLWQARFHRLPTAASRQPPVPAGAPCPRQQLPVPTRPLVPAGAPYPRQQPPQSPLEPCGRLGAVALAKRLRQGLLMVGAEAPEIIACAQVGKVLWV